MLRRGFVVAVLLLAIVQLRVAGADDVPAGFEALFNGKDLSGWRVHGGKLESWKAEDGLLSTAGGGGWLMTEKEYGDFELRLEFKLPKMGNSGVALRAPLMGDPAYTGMEIQVLDDANYKNLKPTQYTGSIYDVVAAGKSANKPAGEWNTMVIVARGPKVAVTVNGTALVDANLDDLKADHAKRHPGLLRARGHLGLQAHGTRIDYRKIFVKPL